MLNDTVRSHIYSFVFQTPHRHDTAFCSCPLSGPVSIKSWSVIDPCILLSHYCILFQRAFNCLIQCEASCFLLGHQCNEFLINVPGSKTVEVNRNPYEVLNSQFIPRKAYLKVFKTKENKPNNKVVESGWVRLYFTLVLNLSKDFMMCCFYVLTVAATLFPAVTFINSICMFYLCYLLNR